MNVMRMQIYTPMPQMRSIIGDIWYGHYKKSNTVELWSLELACLEHQGSLDLFVGPSNFPIHLLLKYTPGSNSDGSTLELKAWSSGRFFM